MYLLMVLLRSRYWFNFQRRNAAMSLPAVLFNALTRGRSFGADRKYGGKKSRAHAATACNMRYLLMNEPCDSM